MEASADAAHAEPHGGPLVQFKVLPDPVDVFFLEADNGHPRGAGDLGFRGLEL